ncbi:MAG: 6-phosphofructokinase [Chromatiales bacterium]|nr:6-phosphofructokinase [Chromatiales bacterium]
MFKAHDIGYFFYNGGGDSADTCLKVSQLGETMGYPIQAIHVPKTVDNDLPITDNCPGFGSVAKYIAVSTREASFDVASMAKTSTKVFVLEVMGRHAGWIAAAGGLAAEQGRRRCRIVILFPEITFDEDKFLAKVDAMREEVRLLHRGRVRGRARAPTASSSPTQGTARRLRPRAARRRRRRWSPTSSRTSLGLQVPLGASPTTCSAPRATSPRRPTSSRPTPWARPRSSWRSRATTR